MRICAIISVLFLLVGCSDEELHSIPFLFQGDWVEISEEIDWKVEHPSELSVNEDGFRMVVYLDYDDLSDTLIFNVSKTTIFSKSEKSIKILNNEKKSSRFNEAVLAYSDGILYVDEYMSRGISGDNFKFIRIK